LAFYKKGEYCKATEWVKKAVTIREEIGVPSARDDLNIVQEKCEESKPTNVTQEKKKAIDWIKELSDEEIGEKKLEEMQLTDGELND
jgi:hypothetical protein